MSAAIVRVYDAATHELVREIPVRDAHHLDRIERGMAINFDFDRFYYRLGADS